MKVKATGGRTVLGMEQGLNERLKVYSPLLGMKEKHETVRPEVWLERRAAPTGAGTCWRRGLVDALHTDKNSRMVGPEPPEARAGVPAADVDIRVNRRKSRLTVRKATRGRIGEVSVSPSCRPLPAQPPERSANSTVFPSFHSPLAGKGQMLSGPPRSRESPQEALPGA